MLWFTADPHFGHDGIIPYCGRPFKDVWEMNDELIRRWNVRVRKQDTVWLLGDICFRLSPKYWLDQLNGHKWYVLGNHDNPTVLRLYAPQRVFDVRYIRWEGHRFFVSHYAHRTWPNMRDGTIHLYGHSHGRLPGIGRSMDVGVDVQGAEFAPWSALEILERLDQPLPNPNDVNFMED